MGDVTSSVAAVVSGASLAAAVGSLWVAIHTARRDRPNLRVRLLPTLGTDNGVWYAQLRAANDGKYVEVLEDIGIEIGGGRRVAWGPHRSCYGRMPAKLEPGESFSAFMTFEELHESWMRDGLRNFDIVGVYADCASGRTYRGPGRPDLSKLARFGHL